MMIKQIAAISSDVQRWSRENAKESRKPFKELINKLVTLAPSSAVVIPKHGDPDIARVVTRGKPLSTVGLRKTAGHSNQCHANSALLYKTKRLDAICTGYALAPDGGWRSHTWGIKDKHLVETTQGGYTMYFGVVLTKAECKEFVEDNL